MAVWQFVLDLIPASAAKVAGVSAARMSGEQLSKIRLSFSSGDAELLLARLDTLLPEKKSWSESVRIWGDEKADDIQVGLAGQAIEDVQFRLNVADLNLSLIGGICALARQLDCRLAGRDGAIIQPNREAVVRMIMQSDAMRFVRDPQRYLAEAVRLDRADE
jgi:hypothetical protein